MLKVPSDVIDSAKWYRLGQRSHGFLYCPVHRVKQSNAAGQAVSYQSSLVLVLIDSVLLVTRGSTSWSPSALLDIAYACFTDRITAYVDIGEHAFDTRCLTSSCTRHDLPQGLLSRFIAQSTLLPPGAFISEYTRPVLPVNLSPLVTAQSTPLLLGALLVVAYELFCNQTVPYFLDIDPTCPHIWLWRAFCTELIIGAIARERAFGNHQAWYVGRCCGLKDHQKPLN